MHHFVGFDHLSPDHIISRHEDPDYLPPFYPYSWEERKWAKIFRKHDEELLHTKEVLHNTRSKLVYVLSLATQVKSDTQRMKEDQKAKIMKDQGQQIQTLSATKNAKQGIKGLAQEQIKAGTIDEISTDNTVCALLIYLINKNPRGKSDKKIRETLIKEYTLELELRGISTVRADLERYMRDLPEERRSKLFK